MEKFLSESIEEMHTNFSFLVKRSRYVEIIIGLLLFFTNVMLHWLLPMIQYQMAVVIICILIFCSSKEITRPPD